MSDKNKQKKKVNQLTLKECESIINRLYNQNENKYYQEVLLQYRRLIPAHKYAIELNKIKETKDATLPTVEDQLKNTHNDLPPF
ncbi:MAG: hypothetical protein EBU90_23605 [Proteobacteria bacterium]|nr:hypothetical protein [Pseudomonadota bacterium]NBP16087.1 hypothetical protein [bacterium]